MCEGGQIFEKGKNFFLSSYGEIPSRKFFLEKEKIVFAKEPPQIADERRRESFAPRKIF